MLPIQRKMIKYNFNKGVNKPCCIVIHDTGNVGKNANAHAHFNYFNGGNRGASAHYFVDDKNIIQFVEDEDASWHCGDGKGKHGISNRNSIGIEICINPESNYDIAVINTIDLTIHLMKKYNITIDRVVTHNNASGKICPYTMSRNNWAKWIEFKSLVQAKLKGVESMTEKQVREIVRDELDRSKEGISTWAKESWDKSVELKVNDGVGAKNYVTEEQLMVFFDRLGLLDEKNK